MKYLSRQLIHYTVFHVLLLLLILNKNYKQPIFSNPMLYKPGYSSSEAPAKRVILYLLEDVGVEEVSTFLPMHENQKKFGPNIFIWSKQVHYDFFHKVPLAPSMCLFMWIKVEKPILRKSYLSTFIHIDKHMDRARGTFWKKS